MSDQRSFLESHSQNSVLPIRLSTPSFGQLNKQVLASYGLRHRKPHYFLVFMVAGITIHGVDLEQYEVKPGELLLILPDQMHDVPATKEDADYFKLNFDNQVLSRLPRQYLFLSNPFHNPKIIFSAPAVSRMLGLFTSLQSLLTTPDTGPDLILSYLNPLLTEINSTYMAGEQKLAVNKIDKYIEFRQFVEGNFTRHPDVSDIARALALSTTSLYNLVKHYSAMSPRQFVNHRLILEAKRRLYYRESSVKELAYDLGFSDPEYFSRLFKKTEGKTIKSFLEDLSGS